MMTTKDKTYIFRHDGAAVLLQNRRFVHRTPRLFFYGSVRPRRWI